MGILIDSGVFIRWERDGGKIDLREWSAFGEPAISVITQSELMVGVHRANTPERRQNRLRFVRKVFANVTVLPVNSPIAEVHAGIVVQLSQSGTPIGPHDNWIAASAIAYDYDLLTTNVLEFQRVPGLRVIDYFATG